MAYLALIPILLPIVAGFGLLLHPITARRARERYVMLFLLLSVAAALAVLFGGPTGTWTLLRFGGNATLAFHADGLSKIFGAMAAILWIPATIYAFSYMEHEGGEVRFFAFYLMSLGVTEGIALSANPITLYLFYELLTLATLPIVMHQMDGKARYAGKLYVAFSMGGAGIAFAAVIYLMIYAPGETSFIMGGFLNPAQMLPLATLTQVIFLLGFFGFGVKAAVFPIHAWLPAASVAPTPVTALLHAVAVVKAGVFAVIRITYYAFGVELLAGGIAQQVMMLTAIVTIVYGSARALRMPHFKRRLAYSTISNLSYMLFGVSLMTPAGLSAALLHMVVHAVSKITLFFCAGAVLCQTGKEYVYELRGMRRRMPIVMGCFLVTGLCLMGVPPLGGFTSKWALGSAAVAAGGVLPLLGVAALIISAVLTALYIFSVVIVACQPDPEGAPKCEPGRYMTGPLIGLTAATLAVSLAAGWLLRVFALV